MRKGISTLVAAVILIATTMSIAGILSYWATSFVRERLITAENSTGETECLVAQFRLYSGSYDNSTEDLILILENQRDVDLFLNDLYLFYGSTLETKDLTGQLESNALKSFNITDVTDNFDRGVIKTTCPDVSVEFTYNQVT
jgi:hypothetical protein